MSATKEGVLGSKTEQIHIRCKLLEHKDYPGSVSGELGLILTGQKKCCNNTEQENKGLLSSQNNTMFTKAFCF